MKPTPAANNWVEVRCILPLIWADPVAEWLLAEKTSGVLIEEGDGTPSGPEGRVSLVTALPAESDLELLLSNLQALGEKLASRSGLDQRLDVETRLIVPEELERLLAPSFRPVELTSCLWVVPDGAEREREELPPGVATIRLTPALAFGTGQHPSTRLAARLTSSWFGSRALPQGPRVLDLGTGSGILAIAASFWGATWVVGVEKDLLAVHNARHNADRNGVSSRIGLVAGDLKTMAPRPWVDLVIANLDKDHFLEGASELSKWLAPGGAMVASGILVDDEKQVAEALEGAGLRMAEWATEEVWVALTLTKG